MRVRLFTPIVAYIATIVIACPSCNKKKYATHPMDFAGVMF